MLFGKDVILPAWSSQSVREGTEPKPNSYEFCVKMVEGRMFQPPYMNSGLESGKV